MRGRGFEEKGYRRRLESEDPKYGYKGRFQTQRRTIFMIVLFVFGLFSFSFIFGLSASLDSKKGKINISSIDPEIHSNKDPASHETSKSQLNLVKKLEDGFLTGYVRVPKIQPGKKTSDDGKLHIIFSSGCNYFQHWQSELLLASAYLVGQRGRITRIVSGCNDRKAETVKHRDQTFPSGTNDKIVPLEQLNRSINENFGLFVTPSFEGAIDFPWINKPNSIKYFMEKAKPELERMGETVIAILDPDFVFLTQLTQTGLHKGEYIASRDHDNLPGVSKPFPDLVQKGRPVAQRYGLEGGWTRKDIYDLEKITGEKNSKASLWSSVEAAKWTSVGPPLILHIDDLYNLSKLWQRYMMPVLRSTKEVDILADMWAYSIGAAQLDLKHTILDHYMISSWGTRGEGYQWVDDFKDFSCANPSPGENDRMPTFIHMASNFKAPDGHKGPWMFHKGHVPGHILNCDVPSIIVPPDNLWRDSVERKTKQQAWVLCTIINKLNKVLKMYKTKFCPIGFSKYIH